MHAKHEHERQNEHEHEHEHKIELCDKGALIRAFDLGAKRVVENSSKKFLSLWLK